MALRELELCMVGEVQTPPLGWSLPVLRREWNSQKEVRAPWWRENSKEAYSWVSRCHLSATLNGEVNPGGRPFGRRTIRVSPPTRGKCHVWTRNSQPDRRR
jgi:hypothetical protein